MISYADTTARVARPPLPAAAAASATRIAFPLAGPGRAADPEEAFVADFWEIVAVKGYVEETDMVRLGWSMAEILEYLPAAMRRGRPVTGGVA